MRQPMQRCAVVAGGILKSFLGRQMDAVLCAIAEGSVRLVVDHLRPGVLQDLLAGLHGLERRVLLWRVGRNAIHLLRIEDGVHTMDEARFVRSEPPSVDVRPSSRSSGRWGWLRSEPGFISQNSICVPFSPLRTCHPRSEACL